MLVIDGSLEDNKENGITVEYSLLSIQSDKNITSGLVDKAYYFGSVEKVFSIVKEHPSVYCNKLIKGPLLFMDREISEKYAKLFDRGIKASIGDFEILQKDFLITKEEPAWICTAIR